MHDTVDILVLGAGWTSTFLLPLLRARNIKFAATTRDGRQVAGEDTIKWSFDPSQDSANAVKEKNQFSKLPTATTILITFPLTGNGQSTTLVQGYKRAHDHVDPSSLHFIQLGSTGIWQAVAQQGRWVTRRSPYDTNNSRAIAEEELLRLDGCVLNLAGLWGGQRDARHWINRVAKTKEDVRSKKSLHMIHGLDVARSIVAVHEDWRTARAQRWMLTDGFVYDWWSLLAGWADERKEAEGLEDDRPDREPLKQATWVHELMREENVRALPRDFETLGRCYSSRDFWDAFHLTPLKARI